MLRSTLLSLFLISPVLLAQEPAPPAVNRPVLKALPLGGDDDPISRPLPETPAPVEPASAPETPEKRTETSALLTAPAPAVIPPPPAPAPPIEIAEPAKPIESISAPTPLDIKPTGDDALRLQIFLDEANFGPGVIDGKPGRFTELAVRSWNEVNGHPLDDWTAVNTAARKAVPHPLAIAIVPNVADKWVDKTLPTKRSLQAKRKRMSYRSYGEFMSERYHCDMEFLAKLNGWQKLNALKTKGSIMVPNVKPFEIERLTGINHPADEAMSARHIVVDTKNNQARIFEAAPAALVVAEPGAEVTQPIVRANRGLVASFPITPGQPKFIKFGTWELRNMVELPWWRYDQKFLDTGKRSENALNIPPGPNSPVGVIWNGTSRSGIGLHGTSDPETIGRARSSGCIRLANWDAVRLPNLIRPGATVEIR